MSRSALRDDGPRYEPGGWGAKGQGWNADSVVAAQEAHWPVLLHNLEGPGPLGVGHWPDRLTREDRSDHNVMMSYGYVLAAAARHKSRLSILDWGGGLGHYYLYSRALLPDVAFEYHCYDVPVLCAAGRRLQPGVHFHESTDTLGATQFDLVMCSAALHFFERWRDVARVLAARARQFLYITRLMVVRRSPSFVVTHRSTHYRTQFQSWCLNRGELLGCVEESGMTFQREFLFEENRVVKNAPEPSVNRGFLFHRTERSQPIVPSTTPSHD